MTETELRNTLKSLAAKNIDHLTLEERAYRRGCYQAIHWAMQGIQVKGGETQVQALFHLARWREALGRWRDDLDPSLLGTYLDEVMERIRQDEEERARKQETPPGSQEGSRKGQE